VWTGAPTPAGARGVAAIELAVVTAVTLVMAALAVSAYGTYTARQEVRGSLAAVTSVQALVTVAFKRTGVPPVSERELPGLPSAKQPDRLIEAVRIKHGAIEMLFGNGAEKSLRGRSVHVTPFETMDGEVVWICGLRPPEVGLYPLGFSGGTNLEAQAGTTVEPRYLPAECR
jgi:Tfp pilus assembly protein PilE